MYLLMAIRLGKLPKVYCIDRKFKPRPQATSVH